MSRPQDFFKAKKRAALLRRINRHCETLAFRDLGFVRFNKNTTFQQKLTIKRSWVRFPALTSFLSLKIEPKETYFDWMITFANCHNFIVVHWHQALLVVARDDAFSSTGSCRRARHLKEEVRTVFWVSKFFLLFMIWTVFMEEVDVRAPKTHDRIWGSINALCPGYWTTSRFNSLMNASITRRNIRERT